MIVLDFETSYGSVNGTGDAVKESRPATAGVEFGGGFVQRSSTSCTAIDAVLEQFVVFSCPWISTLTCVRENLGLYFHSLRRDILQPQREHSTI